MALIMIHGHNQVVLSLNRLQKERVGWKRATAIDTLLLDCFDSWSNKSCLFIAKQTVLTRVGVQTTNGNPRLSRAAAPNSIVFTIREVSSRVASTRLQWVETCTTQILSL